MPFFDTHWQLRWLGAGLASVAAVLLPLRYLEVAAIYDHLHGWNMRPDIVFAAVSGPTLLGVAFLLTRSTRRACARLQWRLERLDADAHPTRHRASPGMISDPAASQKSVITVQRVDIVDRVLGWIFVLIFIVSVLVSAFLLAHCPYHGCWSVGGGNNGE